MRVTRCQYPIGQGCLSSGRIQCAHGECGRAVDYHYIYDCGSTNQRPLSVAIDSYRKRTTSVDALFVSHLHVDHVNGIDRLLGAVRVHTVYIPYVDEVVPILDLIQAEEEGALSASLIEARIDPQSWFGRRGVSRVVRVLASNDEGLAAVEAEDGGNEGFKGRSSRNGGNRLASDAQASGGTGGRAKLETVPSGIPIRSRRSRRGHQWLLVPHVDPAPAGHKKAFMGEIRTALGLAPRFRITTARLADALRSQTTIRSLRDCYERIIPRGSRSRHNHVSMSLYSGPAAGENGLSWQYRMVARCATRPPWLFTVFESMSSPEGDWAVGWIGTGDAPLKLGRVRNAWRRTYHPFSKHLSTLLLPHHGSRHNFDTELLDFPNLHTSVASAGASSRYRHSDPSVIDKVLNRGKVFLHVSECIHTGIREEIRSI